MESEESARIENVAGPSEEDFEESVKFDNDENTQSSKG